MKYKFENVRTKETALISAKNYNLAVLKAEKQFGKYNVRFISYVNL